MELPATRFAAITPSDTVDIANPAGPVAALYVGGAGNVVAVMGDNTTVTFNGVPAGTVLSITVRRINATLTTATNLVALFRV